VGCVVEVHGGCPVVRAADGRAGADLFYPRVAEGGKNGACCAGEDIRAVAGGSESGVGVRPLRRWGVVVAHELRRGEGARTDFPVLIMGVPIAGLSRVAGWPANVAQLAWLILFA
jgi:hypothetical protein